MKKIFSLSLAAALALGFAACSSEDVPDNGSKTGLGTGAYIQMTFAQASGETRAGDAESSEVYVQGSENEYKINNVYLYFFKEDGSLQTVSTVAGGTPQSYAEYTVSKYSTHESTAEQSTSADGLAVQYKTGIYELPSGLKSGTKYHVYALCNKPFTGTITDESSLLESSLSFGTIASGGTVATAEIGNLPMAARAYNGTVYDELNATEANTQQHPFVLKFEVERSYARIAFTNTTFTFPLLPSADAEEKDALGTVTLKGYKVVNESQNFYTYRHVGSIQSGKAVYADAAAKFGKISAADGSYPYVIEPTTTSKSTDSSKLFTTFTNPLGSVTSPASVNQTGLTAAGFTVIKEATASGPQSVEYVAENTMEKDAQYKAQTTGIIFAAQLTPNEVIDSKDHTKIIKYNDGSDLYFYQGKFYSKLEYITDIEGLSKDNMASKQVRYFKSGVGYYEYYIRHLDNSKPTEMGVMEFAIVRNNSYELNVTAICMSPYNGLPGDPKDPDNPDPITPDPKDPDESAKMYLQVEVLVRPWVVRTNNMVLGQ